MENASLANASLALGQTAAALQPAPAAVLAPIVAACVVAVVGAASAGLLHSPLPARSSAPADAAGAAGAAGRRDEKKRAISWAEFKAHSGGGKARAWREGPLWIAIHGKVYDIGGFVASHPGGPLITSMAGRDASDVFMAMHMPRVQSRLPSLCVGELTDAPPPKPVTRDYRALRTRLWKEGWFEADLGYVAWKDCLTAGIFLLGLLAVNCAPSAFGRVGTPPASLPTTPSPASSPTVRTCSASAHPCAVAQWLAGSRSVCRCSRWPSSPTTPATAASHTQSPEAISTCGAGCSELPAAFFLSPMSISIS